MGDDHAAGLVDGRPAGAGGGTPHLFRRLLPVGCVITVIGLMGSFTLPFISLFLSTSVGASPVQTAVFLFLTPLSGVAAATVIGRLSDRPRSRRRFLLITTLCGVAGYGVYASTHHYWVLLAASMSLVAVSAASFPQSFAFARQVLDSQGSTGSPKAISTLRMLVSVSWVAGPPVAALLLGELDFTGLFLLVATGYGLAALIIVSRLTEPAAAAGGPAPGQPGDLPPGGPTMLLAAAAFLMLLCAASLNTLTMPLYVTNELRGTVQQAGWILGLCAVLEIPLMLVFGALTTRIALHRLVLIGAGLGLAYFGVLSVATSVWQALAAQVLAACFISAVAGLGISYFQDLRPGHPGRATTTFTNTQRISAMLAGPVLGLGQHLGYRLAYGSGAVLCAAGLLTLLYAHRRTRRRDSPPRPEGPI